jgi:hypothetical protein
MGDKKQSRIIKACFIAQPFIEQKQHLIIKACFMGDKKQSRIIKACFIAQPFMAGGRDVYSNRL